MKKILSLIILTFYASSIFAQFNILNQGKIKQKKYFQEISYQEIEGLLIVPVTINGKIYKFLFDTGCSAWAISDKIFKEMNLKVIRQINAFDESGEKETMRLVLVPEIDLDGIIFRNTPAVVFHENAESSKYAECFGVDGVIGSNMLRNSVVQFDAQNKQIIITNDIKRVLLQNSECQKMSLELNAPYINITFQKGAQRAVDNVLFDTGNSGFLSLSLNELNGCVVDTIAESEGSFALGAHGFYKKQNHLLILIPEFVVHGLIFNNVITSTTQGKNSGIGVKFLQYGKTTLDYKKKRFYFEPYENIRIDEHSEMPWTVGFTFQNNKMVVGIIWDKQIESTINLGDEVLSINGIDLQSMNFCELFILKISVDDEMILELRNIDTKEIKKVKIKRLQLNKVIE